jgi:hypothetical protein
MFRAVYPARAKYVCTCRTVRIFVLIYLIVFAIILSFYFVPYMKEDSNLICSSIFNPIYHRFMSTIWPPLRTILVCLFPALIMIMANTCLWHQIKASKRRVSPHSLTTCHLSTTDHMLIFLSIANVVIFIVTQVPFHAFTTFAWSANTIDYLRTLMLLWSSLYFGICFYIYCLTSPYFRAKFLTNLRWYFKRDDRTRLQRRTMSQNIHSRH